MEKKKNLTTGKKTSPEKIMENQPTNEPMSCAEMVKELILEGKQNEKIENYTASESLPFIIRIKNMTESKLNNVKLFDHDFEKQNDIKYEIMNHGVSYADFLRFKDVKTAIIGKMYLQCDKSRQLTCNWHYFRNDFNGRCVIVPFTPTIDPMQNQISIVVVNYEMELSLFTQLELKYLLPETEMVIRLYPKTIYK